jgi:hypothetical protein
MSSTCRHNRTALSYLGRAFARVWICFSHGAPAFDVPARLLALVALPSCQLLFHDESDTSRRRHRQTERMSVGYAGRWHRRKCIVRPSRLKSNHQTKQRRNAFMSGRCTRHTSERSKALERRAWIHRGACWLFQSYRMAKYEIPQWDRIVEPGCIGLVSVELVPFWGEPGIPNREFLKLVTDEGSKGLFVGCSPTTDVMDQLMSASIIQVVYTNLTIRFEQISVSVLRILKHSFGSSHRHIIHLPQIHLNSDS